MIAIQLIVEENISSGVNYQADSYQIETIIIDHGLHETTERTRDGQT